MGENSNIWISDKNIKEQKHKTQLMENNILTFMHSCIHSFKH